MDSRYARVGREEKGAKEGLGWACLAVRVDPDGARTPPSPPHPSVDGQSPTSRRASPLRDGTDTPHQAAGVEPPQPVGATRKTAGQPGWTGTCEGSHGVASGASRWIGTSLSGAAPVTVRHGIETPSSANICLPSTPRENTIISPVARFACLTSCHSTPFASITRHGGTSQGRTMQSAGGCHAEEADMTRQQKQTYCKVCQRKTLHVKSEVKSGCAGHVVLTLVTCGL